jgi:hypothetical protein
MTLAELTVGMVILSVVAVAVAGLTTSLSDAYAGGERFYDSLQMARVSMLRIEAQARKAKMPLSDDDTTQAAFALWNEDGNGDGQVNLSEIELYWYQSGTKRLICQTLTFPQAQKALDYPMAPEALSNVTNVILFMWWFEPYRADVVLCENVTSCRFVTDKPAPDSTLLSIYMRVGNSDNEVQLQSAVALTR